MSQSEMAIFTRTFDFLSWLLPVTNNFPRAHRHTVHAAAAGRRLRPARTAGGGQPAPWCGTCGAAAPGRRGAGACARLHAPGRAMAVAVRRPISACGRDGGGDRSAAGRLAEVGWPVRDHSAGQYWQSSGRSGRFAGADSQAARVAWRLVQQQCRQRALRGPQQEQPEQQEQEQRVSSCAVHIFPMGQPPNRKCPAGAAFRAEVKNGESVPGRACRIACTGRANNNGPAPSARRPGAGAIRIDHRPCTRTVLLGKSAACLSPGGQRQARPRQCGCVRAPAGGQPAGAAG